MRRDQGHDPVPRSSMPEPVAANQRSQGNAALRTLLRVGKRRCPEAGPGGVRTLPEDLREADNARLRAGAVGLERLRVGQQVGKPLADGPGHLHRRLTRPSRELAGNRSQNPIPGAPLPAVQRTAPLRLHAPNRTDRAQAIVGMRQRLKNWLARRDGSSPDGARTVLEHPSRSTRSNHEQRHRGQTHHH